MLSRKQRYSEMEIEAVRRLSSRPAHLSVNPANLALSSDGHKQLETSYRNASRRYTQLGTRSSISWNPGFKLLSAQLINPDFIDNNVEPAQFNFYYHAINRVRSKELYVTCHNYSGSADGQTSLESIAKIFMVSAQDLPYQNGARGCLYICEINSFDHQYRLGTALIQAAVELSIKEGFDGRIAVCSRKKSGQFFFKLGFIPEDHGVFDRLKKGEEINGKTMHLPEDSIAIWKQKIAQRSILKGVASHEHGSYVQRFSLYSSSKNNEKVDCTCSFPFCWII